MSGGVTALAIAWAIFGPRRWLAGIDLRGAGVRITRPAVVGLVAGTLLGPVLCVWMSLVAVRSLDAGVASTLMSLSPVLVLPIARIVDRERIGWRAAVGAAVAVGGGGAARGGGQGRHAERLASGCRPDHRAPRVEGADER